MDIKNIKKGALRKEVMQRYGKKAFNNKNDIKIMYLKLMLKNADLKTKKRIILALNFRKMRGLKWIKK